MIKLQAIGNQLSSIVNHLKNVLSTGYGWLCVFSSTIFGFIFTEWKPFAAILALVIIDFIWGIIASVWVRKESFLSSLVFDTVIKIAIYSTAFITVSLIEYNVHESEFISTIVILIFAGACELWSMSANMLIVVPNMPFLRLFRLQLRGEIENKTNRNINHIFKEDGNECTRPPNMEAGDKS